MDRYSHDGKIVGSLLNLQNLGKPDWTIKSPSSPFIKKIAMLRRPSSSTPKSVQMNWKWLSKQDHSSRTGKTAVLRVVGVSVRKGLNKVFLFKHHTFRGDINRLQRLGLVLHLSPSRNIIVKVENCHKIGETVVDENLRPVGKIFDIFGPVSSPYAAVRPTTSDPEKLVNQKLYVLPLKRRKEKEKNEWRRRT